VKRLNVINLRVEGENNPLGIDSKAPRISWQIDCDTPNFLQFAYQIQVAENVEDYENHLVWDSRKVISEQSHYVKYQGKALNERVRYYFRIRIWNKNNEVSKWSQSGNWEMGILDRNTWKAKWITQKSNQHDQPNPFFRKTFTITKKVKSARVYSTSLGLYELHLNGEKVGSDFLTPGWTNYEKWLQYQTYDVTSQIIGNENTIGVVLGNGWFRGGLNPFRGITHNIYGKEIAALIQLHILFEDDTETIICTDESWKTSTGPIQYSDIYNGEVYNAGLNLKDWDTASFIEKDWCQADILETKRNLVAQIGNPVRVLEKVKPVQLITTPLGETVLDMGQNMVGWMIFKVRGKQGQKVVLQHAEVLDENGNFYTENLRQAKQTIKYICSGEGEELYQPHFTFQGFRYVKIIGFPNDISISDFEGYVIGSTINKIGHFETSHPLINQLQSNIQWGQKGNFVDVPTDCPQRDERLGWTGDAAMFIPTATFNYDVSGFFKKWLLDVKKEQELRNGIVPIVIPNILGGSKIAGIAGWSDAAVICPWNLYLSYGDQGILEEQYDSMKNWLEYVHSQCNEQGLWNQEFQLGDWLALDGDPNSPQDQRKGGTDETFVANAFYANSLSIFVKVSTLLGRTIDAERFKGIKSTVIKSIRENYFTEKGTLTIQTQTAHVLALVFNLVEEEKRKSIADNLAKLVSQNNFHLTTGFLGTPFICHALSQNGYPDVAYRLLLNEQFPSWLYQVKNGATTIWERWNGIQEDGTLFNPNMNSFNHYAFGSIGAWMYQEIGGLKIDESRPGYKNIIINPKITELLDSAYVSLNTPYGIVKSEWTRSGNKVYLNIFIPPNSTATIKLEDADINEMYMNNELIDNTTFAVGSGTYEIVLKKQHLELPFKVFEK
jgi:alpha-L-rhamnosidase